MFSGHSLQYHNIMSTNISTEEVHIHGYIFGAASPLFVVEFSLFSTTIGGAASLQAYMKASEGDHETSTHTYGQRWAWKHSRGLHIAR